MRAVLASLLVLLVAAPAALGSPTGDYTDVRKDFQGDQVITPCKFTRGQLENARRIAVSSPDLSYTGLVNAIEGELRRRCSAALAGFRIVSVKGSGQAVKERVVLRNAGTKTLTLAGTLRNRAGKRVALPSTKVKRGGRVNVSLGCLKGRRAKRGTRLFACAKGNFLKDSGDVVRLFDRGG
ncbi:MAG: hypothetical protein H0T15_06220 [Thermoleophilaceae bacterium]|nr:hypothetical protein [Thermoleophilaceae bacterium]